MVIQLENLSEEDRSLFPTQLTIDALRDSRYASTAYAISELIDNSIEAGAPLVQLLCEEEYTLVVERTKRHVSRIAVFDNGSGMKPLTLYHALRFGGGTKHQSQRGMGKYGMGLPTSSLSQCKRVDVWTWQDGISSAWHSAIDIDEIAQSGNQAPMPEQSPVPSAWLAAGDDRIGESKTGTLVVWSKLDKIQWKTSGAIIRNVTQEVGRIHRHFIQAKRTNILASTFGVGTTLDIEHTEIVPNDPIYLMAASATPAPWNMEPMFKEWFRKSYDVPGDKGDETIDIVYSIVKPEALKTESVTTLPGRLPHGQHARHNIGVSVVRENREIILEDAFTREGGGSGDPRQRWWGCEIRFNRGCDELFGVDINKQMVAKFTQAAKTLARDDRDVALILDELGLERETIYTLVSDIRQEIRAMMREIDKMFGQRRGEQNEIGKRNPTNTATTSSSAALNEAIVNGEETPSETDRTRMETPPAEREAALTEELIDTGRPEQDARELARSLVAESQAYLFNSANVPGYLMFGVESRNGILNINLNTDHVIYELINSVERDINENADEHDPAFQAAVAIRIMLLCWARMEDQTASSEERRQIQHIAGNWGRYVDRAIRHWRASDNEG